MKLVRTLPIVFSLVAVGTTAWAAQHDGHKAHHPAGSTAAAKATPGSPEMARMDTQMKAMQAMHDKMMAATTPEARNALMAEHMKTMQDGMGMMKGMGSMGMGKDMGKDTGGMSDPKAKPVDMAQRQRMMEQRMDMMQAMMEMMVDRLQPSPAKP